jgi:uncharacterized protein YndB with AHSA1/START domain
MAEVTIKRLINAPVEKVWESWDDFANIDQFNPNLNASFLINDSKKTGLGAERQCDLVDGKNYIQERIIDYVPNRRIVVDIYNGTLPLKRAKATIALRPVGGQTELSFTMEFIPKMGVLGKMMVPLMKPQFRKLLTKLVEANKSFAETGQMVHRAA